MTIKEDSLEKLLKATSKATDGGITGDVDLSEQVNTDEHFPDIYELKERKDWTPLAEYTYGETVPRYHYHRAPMDESGGAKDGGIKAYKSFNPKESPFDKHVFMARNEPHGGHNDSFHMGKVTSVHDPRIGSDTRNRVIDITKLKPENFHMGTEAELVHNGDIPFEAIVDINQATDLKPHDCPHCDWEGTSGQEPVALDKFLNFIISPILSFLNPFEKAEEDLSQYNTLDNGLKLPTHDETGTPYFGTPENPSSYTHSNGHEMSSTITHQPRPLPGFPGNHPLNTLSSINLGNMNIGIERHIERNDEGKSEDVHFNPAHKEAGKIPFYLNLNRILTEKQEEEKQRPIAIGQGTTADDMAESRKMGILEHLSPEKVAAERDRTAQFLHHMVRSNSDGVFQNIPRTPDLERQYKILGMQQGEGDRELTWTHEDLPSSHKDFMRTRRTPSEEVEKAMLKLMAIVKEGDGGGDGGDGGGFNGLSGTVFTSQNSGIFNPTYGGDGAKRRHRKNKKKQDRKRKKLLGKDKQNGVDKLVQFLYDGSPMKKARKPDKDMTGNAPTAHAWNNKKSGRMILDWQKVANGNTPNSYMGNPGTLDNSSGAATYPQTEDTSNGITPMPKKANWGENKSYVQKEYEPLLKVASSSPQNWSMPNGSTPGVNIESGRGSPQQLFTRKDSEEAPGKDAVTKQNEMQQKIQDLDNKEDEPNVHQPEAARAVRGMGNYPSSSGGLQMMAYGSGPDSFAQDTLGRGGEKDIRHDEEDIDEKERGNIWVPEDKDDVEKFKKLYKSLQDENDPTPLLTALHNVDYV